MLLQSLAILYSTHVLLECLNLGVVVLVSLLAIHGMVVSSRALYTSNLYVELVWLLAPTVVVVSLLARTVAMQCSDEEITYTPCCRSTEVCIHAYCPRTGAVPDPRWDGRHVTCLYPPVDLPQHWIL